MKKIIAFLVSLLAILSTFVQPMKTTSALDQTLYFFNSRGWRQVYVYAYLTEGEDNDEPFGGWPGKPAAPIGDGSLWWSIEVNDELPLNIIFNNRGTDQAGGVYITNFDNPYITMRSELTFSTKAEAEGEMEGEIYDASAKTDIYFYNAEGWFEPKAYAFGTIHENITGRYPGINMERETNDDYWYTASIPSITPFYLILSDELGQQVSMYVKDDEHVYFGPIADQLFTSRQAVKNIFLNPKDIPMQLPDTEIAIGQETETNIFYPAVQPFDVISIILASLSFVVTTILAVLFFIFKRKKLI